MPSFPRFFNFGVAYPGRRLTITTLPLLSFLLLLIFSQLAISAAVSSPPPQQPETTDVPLSAPDFASLRSLQDTCHRWTTPKFLFKTNVACLRTGAQGISFQFAWDELFVVPSYHDGPQQHQQQQYQDHSSDDQNEYTESSREAEAGQTDEREGTKSPYFPWTHPILCTPFLSFAHSPLCVYTNATFASGRGISLFTTPALAHTFSLLPPFTSPSALSPFNSPNTTTLLRPSSIKGKGIGLLTTQPLPRGTTLLATTPILLALLPNTFPLSTLSRETFLTLAISQLPPSTQSTFLSLSKMYNTPRFPVQDILKANAFQMVVGGGGAMHVALFPEASRINHDCGPNAMYHLDPEVAGHVVVLTRDVEEGEEVSVSYTGPLDSFVERQQFLRQAFNFECRCSRCRRGIPGDSLLHKITSLEAEMRDWADGECVDMEDVERLVRMYEKEGLEGFMEQALGFGAIARSCEEDEKGVGEWAGRAREVVGWRYGEKGVEDWESWGRLVEEPRGHWSWGWNGKRRGGGGR